MAILSALVGFCYLIGGFNNRQLVQRVGALLQSPYTCRQATYDLRRLKRKELIAKVPHTNRYQLTHLSQLARSVTWEAAPDGHRGQKVCTTGAML